MSHAPGSKLDIDIISDVVCPWCLIGTRRLEIALESFPGIEVNLRYHPFLLDPSTPAEGRDLRQHLRAKYGADPEAMFERVESAAKSSGIELDFSKVRRSCNTVLAHTLLRYVAERPDGMQKKVARALFDAYFMDGADIGNLEVLVALAEKNGLTVDEAHACLTDEAAIAETRAEAASAAQSGISGVPFVVIDQKVAVPGAQEPELFRRSIAKALEARGETLIAPV